jgi:arabinogalactan endo-1,4-beta-galactosidase
LSDVISKVRAVKDSMGVGVFYWEPEAYGGWKGYSYGAFDATGKPMPSLDAFLE